jgi:erythromycin esterase
MKRRLLPTAARFGLSTILLVSSAIAHCGENAFAKWATAHALPVTMVDSASADSDLLPLKSVIGNARIVALGEPIHHAHEPLAFRNRLFRFLVEQMGFTAIALEYGFTESGAMDSFIDGGEGDTANVAREPIDERLHIEDRELIQWMRDYNAAASSAGRRRIRFYGIDITAGARHPGIWRSRFRQ